jgi:hypothetical protein
VTTDKDKPALDENSADYEEKWDQLIRDLRGAFPSSADEKLLYDFINIIKDAIYAFTSKTIDINNFISISIIENILSAFNSNIKLLGTELIINLISQINQDIFIDQKKRELKEKGVKVRKYRLFSKSIMTLHGTITYNRMGLIPATPDHAKKLTELGEQKIIFPLDEAIGAANLPFKLTVPAMLEVAYWVQSSSSYESAAKQLKKATGIVLAAETIRSIANTIGKIIFDIDAKDADNAFNLLKSGALELPEEQKSHILYLLVDGAMLHTREKNAEGSTWRENKLGLAFSTEYFKRSYDKKSSETKFRINKREYRAFVGDADTFKKHFFALALKNGYGSFKETVLLSDGATWIRSVKDELCPDAQQILDFHHLCKNVSDFAKGAFAKDEIKYNPWSENICKLFKEGQAEEAITQIRALGKKKMLKSSINLLSYIENNKNNIDYQKYIKKGYFIDSGAIESGRRSVLQQRLKQPGMRWNIDSGQYIVTLMSKVKSDLWNEEVVEPVLDYYGIKKENTIFSGIHAFF